MCMLAFSFRLLAVAVLGMGLALQGGCATPARPEQMATQTMVERAPAALLGKIAVGEVTGGKRGQIQCWLRRLETISSARR